jgi:transcription elongation factor Elf1
MGGQNKKMTEELDVQETRRIIGPNSYDDNFNLIGYTSELRDKDDRFYGFVDFNADDVGKIRECPHCLEYKIHNKLQPRILKKGEVRPPDYDEFIQCYECGNIFGIHETHFESKIKDSVETTDNPFEGNESVFLSTDNRKTQRRKGKQKSKFKVGEHKDPEIQAAIDKGLAVNILYDSSR